MHFSLILVALALAGTIRLGWGRPAPQWRDRWHNTLGRFLAPPLLLFTTAIAVLCMGTQGTMVGLPVGWLGYSIAIGFLITAIGVGGWLAWQGVRSLHQVRRYPQVECGQQSGRLLDTAALFAGQVGFWRSELVISRGLLQTLTPEQRHAVLLHEQAHAHYRDTFWFFWLGWLRHLTNWLPQTETLWQELLLLRELRADCWAAQRVDALLLAESLLLVVKAPLYSDNPAAVAFGQTPINRLEERIDALLAAPSPSPSASQTTWIWLLLPLLPLLTVALHT